MRKLATERNHMHTSNCVRMVSIRPASPGVRVGCGWYLSVLLLENFWANFDFFSSFLSLVGKIRPLERCKGES